MTRHPFSHAALALMEKAHEKLREIAETHCRAKQKKKASHYDYEKEL